MCNLKHFMSQIIADHGHAAVVQEIVAHVGWQARWMASKDAERAGKAVEHLLAALNILTILEKEEAAERAE